jgi:hypothetical protein
MPNLCSNKLTLVFKTEKSKLQFKQDLENLKNTGHEENICQLVLPISEDATVDKCNDIWGTKWGTYDTYIDEGSETEESLVFYYNTAWSPFNEQVFKGLYYKYNLYNLEMSYWESGCAFCGTMSNSGEEIIDNYLEYDSIDVPKTSYEDFVKLVERNTDISLSSDTQEESQKNRERLTKIYNKFKNYQYMFVNFESIAYKVFIDPEEEPIFREFVYENISDFRVFCPYDEDVFYVPETKKSSIWGDIVDDVLEIELEFDDMRVSGWIRLMDANPNIDQTLFEKVEKQVKAICDSINYSNIEDHTFFEIEYLRDAILTIVRGIDESDEFRSIEGLNQLVSGLIENTNSNLWESV